MNRVQITNVEGREDDPAVGLTGVIKEDLNLIETPFHVIWFELGQGVDTDIPFFATATEYEVLDG
jgi:hypothetical protein